MSIALSDIHGFGVFADRHYHKGDFIGLVCFFKEFWHMTQWAIFVNHSVSGNSYVTKNANRIILYASKDILPGEEITSNYLEWNKTIDHPKLDISFLQRFRH